MKWRLSFLVLQACALCAVTRATKIVCNYCFDADVIDDCHLNIQQCDAKHICFVDVKHTEYKSPTDGNMKTMTRYKMGCLFASLCRDSVSTEPGLYGLATVFRSCCCTNLCGVPDGIGRGNRSACPDLFTKSVPVLNGAVGVWPPITKSLTAKVIVGTLAYCIWP